MCLNSQRENEQKPVSVGGTVVNMAEPTRRSTESSVPSFNLYFISNKHVLCESLFPGSLAT